MICITFSLKANKLFTGDICIRQTEASLTNCAPGIVDTYLYTTLSGISDLIVKWFSQSQGPMVTVARQCGHIFKVILTKHSHLSHFRIAKLLSSLKLHYELNSMEKTFKSSIIVCVGNFNDGSVTLDVKVYLDTQSQLLQKLHKMCHVFDCNHSLKQMTHCQYS